MVGLVCPKCAETVFADEDRCLACGARLGLTPAQVTALVFAEKPPGPEKPRPRGLPTRGSERAEYGCICSFADDDGKRLTLTASGPILEILPGLLDEALARDPSFRLIAYSTPETVYADLVGLRADSISADGFDQARATPEANVLGRVRRSEMLHPSLALRSDPRRLESTRVSRQTHKRLRRKS